MYENYTSQALPSKKYRELLGSALCVFNANTGFIIENILNSDDNNQYNWYTLTDREAGRLLNAINSTITQKSNSQIANLFKGVVDMRNRIIHSFQTTTEDGEQILTTKMQKKDGNKQFDIDEGYLLDFIKKNETLNRELNGFREQNGAK